MNTPEDERDLGTESIIGLVPFLNGGLFDRTELDEREPHVDDEIISGIIGPGGLFSQYNFTVTEATPLDTEVAVDPEMLGKLFEETVNERHDNGAYYTPRLVVAFMCREALKGYISGKGIVDMDQVKITGLVDDRNPKVITTSQALQIAKAVAEIKAVDPACGSGAFLLGMIQEIIALNDTLFRAGKTPDSLYQQKLDIITNNIYGADKDGLAVSTAMLRLWLSLAVEFEGEGIPEPLPNLDMKLAIGDSIAGPNPKQLDLTFQTIANSDLRDNVAKYTTAQGERKIELRKRIREIKNELREMIGDAAPEGTVEWRIEFADVTLNGGFDVAIANPPYVRLQANGGELADLYENAGFTTFTRTGDLYQLFYERGCQLLRQEQGILAYVTSNSWLKAEYGKPLRRYFTDEHTPNLMLDLGKDVFESAIVDSGVLVLSTGGASQQFPAVDMDRVSSTTIPPAPELWGLVRPSGNAPWSVMSVIEHGILDKMRMVGTALKEWNVKINYGIKTGYNKAFLIDDATLQKLMAFDHKSAEIVRPVLRGKDIQRYRSEWAGQWLIDTHNGFGEVSPVDIDSYPAVKDHLDAHYPNLEKRGDKGNTPYHLRDCAYYEEFAKEKLLWIELVDRGRFSYDNSGIICANTAYMLSGDSIKYLCALLNSRLVTWFMNSTALTSGMGATRWIKSFVETIPIPNLDPDDQLPFVGLVDQILKAKSYDFQANITESEMKIDTLVYELYGLTNEEVSIVEGNQNSL